MTSQYLGNLRVESVHLPSGNKIITDAPTDNHGRGEAFSPTDLLCTSLASCMITLMGISASNHGIVLETINADITKVMYTEPRRVGEIHISFNMPGNLPDKYHTILEKAALTCPVKHSLHPDILLDIQFNW